jgi:hypothetical protein
VSEVTVPELGLMMAGQNREAGENSKDGARHAV